MVVELSPRIGALIKEKVESGEYPDADAVVTEAMRLLQERDDEAKLERLRAMVQVGLDQAERGEVIELTPDLYEKIWENARRKLREGHHPKADVCP